MTTILSKSSEDLPFLKISTLNRAYTTTNLMIGIAASNEEQNIGLLLDNLVKNTLPEIESICIISSGSTDKTNEIITQYSRKDERIQLIIEKERNGKATALNLLLEESEKYDYMIYMGGDNLPDQESLDRLLNPLKTQGTDIVGGRPIPIDDPNTFMGFCAHLLWNLHHESSLQEPKISGELMAFRTKIIRELPPAIINDDAYIQSICEMKKCKVAYCPEAKVLLKGPSTVQDFITQRKRVFIGHKQLEFLIGNKVSTMNIPKWPSILKACPFRGLKGRVYAVGFIFLQGIAFLSAKWDFARHKLPYKWKLVKTTKSLQNANDDLLAQAVESLEVRN